MITAEPIQPVVQVATKIARPFVPHSHYFTCKLSSLKYQELSISFKNGRSQ